MNVCLCLFVLFLSANFVLCKRFEPSELYFTLQKCGMETDIDDWMCLADKGGKRHTATITAGEDGTLNLGIFQINSKFCKFGSPGGLFNLKCEDLLTDDISTSVQIALKIKDMFGFEEWKVWRDKCEGQDYFIPCKKY